MVAQPAAHPGSHLLVVGLGPPVPHVLQERTDDFPVVLVLEADDDGARDGRVGGETLFDLKRVYVFAA